MRKQIAHKALHGLLALAFLLTMGFGTLHLFGKLQATYAAGISITEYPLPNANSDPMNITNGPDGNLWFTEWNTGKIGRITPAGVITEFSLSDPGTGPYDITAGPDGNLWFTGSSADVIGRITPAGVITVFPLPINSEPTGITAGLDGNLWFTEYQTDKIGRITPAGVITEFSLSLPALTFPYDIAAGSDGNLWFTEINGSQIGRITPAGIITEFTTSSGYNDIDITTGLDGNLWFTETGNMIGRITPSGVDTEFPMPTSSEPQGITAGSDGNVWFTDTSGYGNQIGQINIGGATSPSGQWLKPTNGFSVQEGNTISLSVQADPGLAPIADITISATWPGSSGTICDLRKPDSGTIDHYSCKWNFVSHGSYIPAGSVTFHTTITDQDGNQISDPGGARTGTFSRYNSPAYNTVFPNWGGYYAYGGNSLFGGNTLYSDVKATWKVPALQTCGSSENSDAVVWVGLGGVDGGQGNQDLEQIGTEDQCLNGTSAYYAWWEMVQGSNPTTINRFALVKPGDTVVAEVYYKGNGIYHLSISINGISLPVQDQLGAGDTIARNSADWVVERPLIGGTQNVYTQLAHYGTVKFTNCSVNGKPMTYGPTLYHVLLENQQGIKLEKASYPLNGTDNGFTVSWLQSQ